LFIDDQSAYDPKRRIGRIESGLRSILPSVLAAIVVQFLTVVDHSFVDHSWMPASRPHPSVAIDGTAVRSNSHGYHHRIISTNTIRTSPRRWRILVEFSVIDIGWIAGVGVTLSSVAQIEKLDELDAAPAMATDVLVSAVQHRFITNIRPISVYKSASWYDRNVCTLQTLKTILLVEVDESNQFICVDSERSRTVVALPTNDDLTADYRPCVLLGGPIAATILPWPNVV
jgi:hypothetical protein